MRGIIIFLFFIVWFLSTLETNINNGKISLIVSRFVSSLTDTTRRGQISGISPKVTANDSKIVTVVSGTNVSVFLALISWFWPPRDAQTLKLYHSDDVGVEPIYSDEEEDEPERPEEEEEDSDEDDEDDEEEDIEAGNRSETSSHGESRSSKPRRSGTPTPPKLDARARFASNLLLLNGVHLGHVISMLEKQCPGALESDSLQIPERMEIVIDKIEPAEIFQAVASYAAEKAVRNKRSVTPKIEDVSNKRAKR